MTDLTPADRALLAWHTLPCRYPSCRQPVGRRCVTAKGDRTSPHAIRLADLDIWLSRQPEVDTLTAQLVDAAANAEAMTAQLKIARLGAALVPGLQQQIADLLAYKAAHPDVPRVWKPLYSSADYFNRTGWTINAGPRPAVDASVGKPENVSITPSRIVLTAKREGSTITSCDIISKHKPLPRFHAIELDVIFSDDLGPGMFPCPLWEKGIHGIGGEFDGLEQLGALFGSDYLWKMTLIELPATSPLHQWQRPLVPFFKAHGITPTEGMTLRYEHTDGKVEMFAARLGGDLDSAATITREDVDGPGPMNPKTKQPYWGARPGRFDEQFQPANEQLYTRHTWQVGPRGDGKTGGMGGAVRDDWQSTTMTIPRMVAEEYVG